MTCIVAIKNEINNKIVIGCDSAMVSGPNSINISDESKVVIKTVPTINANEKGIGSRNLLVGFTGAPRPLYMLKYHTLPIHNTDDISDREYLATLFTDSLISILENKKCITTEDEGVSGADAEFLIVYNGNIYKMDEVFFIYPIGREYTSIGSGAEFALGSLYTPLDDYYFDITYQCLIALDAASNFCAYVRRPFRLYTIDGEDIVEDCYDN